ncbi:uncharacterized protein MONBRDRAFT_33095 [Monosiga brevicollis MX1]|uniref:Nucleoporin Nup54 alpha-helical domain-containing protein n=1 Tax=Monosiga brevicollis TaxID=81824 RepID=A9V3N9_MONBE|nr:uncharacterized protein MONBRDRAFT_33095 [Monosiga brevicollis MX1]EDQ87736.1 predicted protein [Monosiga brevicollis MX1]|eukprot:XP_001747269.1 hypothetical protein [Monosiga brevicollis MX1]
MSTGFGSAPATGFGSAPATGFGTAGSMQATRAATTFGAPAATSTAGTTGFGAKRSPAVGFGTPGSAPATGFGTTTGFGTPGAATTTGFGATSTSTAGFGKPATGFGSTATSGFGVGGFGQQQQQQAQQQPQPQGPQRYIPAEYHVQRHGDARDDTIKRFNHMQAMWGHGTFFLSTGQPNQADTAKVPKESSYNAFKTVAYNLLPRQGDREGRIGIIINGSYDEIKENVKAIESHLQNKVLKQLLKPLQEVYVDSVRMTQEGKVELIFQVLDRTKKPLRASKIDEFLAEAYKAGASATGATTSGLGGFGKPTTGFGKPTTGFGGGGFGSTAKTGFGTSTLGGTTAAGAGGAKPHHKDIQEGLQSLGCETKYNAQAQRFDVKGFYPVVERTREQVLDALKRPDGIPSELWAYARKANPDPERYFPVPIFGFDGLARRSQIQDEELSYHRERLTGDFDESIQSSLHQVVSRQDLLKGKIDELQHNAVAIGSRILRLMRFAAREDRRMTLQDLNTIGNRLGAMTRQIDELQQGRVSELKAKLELSPLRSTSTAHASLPTATIKHIMNHLQLQQRGIDALLQTLQESGEKIQIMREGYSRLA